MPSEKFFAPARVDVIAFVFALTKILHRTGKRRNGHSIPFEERIMNVDRYCYDVVIRCTGFEVDQVVYRRTRPPRCAAACWQLACSCVLKGIAERREVDIRTA